MNCLRRLPRPAVLISALLFAANCCGQERVALLIGNSEYDDKPLPQVSGQLEVLSAALKRHGFTVTTKQNVGKSLREDIQQFATSGAALRGPKKNLRFSNVFVVEGSGVGLDQVSS